ncbi:CBS domain-containing protein [Streptomyces sp. A7024]|uniref:CBS domain-containing protein n=1 Tax=Streptomyces coryli TaxID=1128680 RepID=A0A6G4TTN7_9ACTN|nr:CBS domain-containing protein [Streptomyces coryli]NGN62468.1 CBS domain-containing protein [Streptomyces coryli]
MKHRKIGNVMTSDVVTVQLSTPFKEVARLLQSHGISGLPVVDDDEQVLGVISETDLMLRQAEQPDPYAPPRRRLPRITSRARRAYGKARAQTAEQLMSKPAITVRPGDTVTQAARTMTEHGVERLPVVDEESRLIGIVTRRDLLQVFVRPDEEIRQEIVDEVLVRALWVIPQLVRVTVAQGVVTFEGELERQSEVEIAEQLAKRIDGVIGVVNKMTYRLDDSHIPPVEPPYRSVGGDWMLHRP